MEPEGHRLRNSHQLVSILGHTNPVALLSVYVYIIYFNIILPAMPTISMFSISPPVSPLTA